MEPGVPFKVDPANELFILREKGFYEPPDRHLVLRLDPREWLHEVMATIGVALEPVAAAELGRVLRDAAARALA